MKDFDPAILQPGDHLLYRPSSFFGWGIALKTCCRLSHIEIYMGDGGGRLPRQSMASRDGVGVNIYPLRTKGLAYVLRPLQPIDMLKANIWLSGKIGDKYDWRDIATFLFMGKPCGEARKEICSEIACMFDRAGDFNPVRKDLYAGGISPADFFRSPAFTVAWSDE